MGPVNATEVDDVAGASCPTPGSVFPLRLLAWSAVAAQVRGHAALNRESPEWRALAEWVASVPSDGEAWRCALVAALEAPVPEDRPLVQLAALLSCTAVEILAVVLAAAVDEDLMAGRVLAFVQAPIGGARPTLGLLSTVLAGLAGPERRAMDLVLTGTAMRSGLLVIHGDEGPLPERTLSVPQAVGLALRGCDGVWPGAMIGVGADMEVPLPPSVIEAARQHAKGLVAAPHHSLVIRSGFLGEAKSAAAAIASVLQCRPVFVETDKLAGLGPWLMLRGLLPVFLSEAGPGERKTVPEIPGYAGPVLAVTTADGQLERGGRAMPVWVVPVPPVHEREQLWQRAIGEGEAARTLAETHRHSSARIHLLGTLARGAAATQDRVAPLVSDVVAVSVTGAGTGLDVLAQLLRDPVPDEALVVPPSLRAELGQLAVRCRVRERLASPLGVAVAARYRPGVRALFVGPSGTGKTLAAGWLSTRLGLPLYRVDLASVTSKYIGETEKNLAQLFAQAERSDVVLLFDEADSLFGKRTEIKDSNDRFANAQTNYVLQRIESYDGIVVLTSNSRSRFDSAFSRRLDTILEFPAPGPEERRDLWLAHLGSGHDVSPSELNRLAATVDLAGGHIRNVVLAAAVVAHEAGRVIGPRDVAAGLVAEYRKLGRPVPAEWMGH